MYKICFRKSFFHAMFPKKPFPDLCHVCYEAFPIFLLCNVEEAFGNFCQKAFYGCLQCLSESLSLVRPETGTGEVVVGPLGSARLQLNQAL